MKKVLFVLIGLLLTTNVYAVDITVSVTQDQYDALSVITSTPEEWVQNAVDAKANSMIDSLVDKHSDKQASKISKTEKGQILGTIDLEKEKNERRGIRGQ